MAQQQRAYFGGRGGGKQNPEVMKALRQWARDAGFNESNVKRDEGGKFSAQQHQAAASQHSATAAKHPDKQVAKAHADAAQAHTLAAKHIAAQTGWQYYRAAKAHKATQAAQAAEQQAGGPANAEQLKAVAADPKQPLSARADAVKQLTEMEKQADVVAGSPLAVPTQKEIQATNEQMRANIPPAIKAQLAALAGKIKSQQNVPALTDEVKPKPFTYSAAAHPVGSRVGFTYGEGYKGTGTVLSHGAGGMRVKSDIGENEHLLDARNDPRRLDSTQNKKPSPLAPIHPSKNAGPTKGSTLGPDMPGFKIPPKPADKPAPATKAKEPRAPRAISGAKLDAYIASFAKAKAAGTTPTAPAAPAAPVNGGLGGSNWRKQPFAPVDKKSAASAYKGTSAGPLHINTTSEKKDK